MYHKVQKGGLFMTYFVGIDVAKYTHVLSCIDSTTGELIHNSISFDNDSKGFNELLSKLSILNKDEIVIGFESTAHYHQALFNFLTQKNYKCILVNPLQTSRFRNLSLRDVKNDNVDSRSIAKFLLFEYEHLTNEEFQINELKDLCNQRESLKDEKAKLKVKLLADLDRVFPELEKIVGKSGIHSNGIRAILKEYPSAMLISNVRIDHLINIANKASRNKYKEHKVKAVKETAKNSIGFHSNALALRIQQYIILLELIEKQIDEVTQSIVNHSLVINSPLLKIKGLGYIEIAYILSAIININRFDDPSKVVAYAGLDPRIRQSGTFNALRTRMSKRGNKLLRYALIWGANNVRKHSSQMKEYYQIKRSQNKNHYNALGHCATKLIRYIFFVLNNPEKEFVC